MAEKRAKRPRIKVQKQVNPKTGKVRYVKRISDENVTNFFEMKEPADKYWQDNTKKFVTDDSGQIVWPDKLMDIWKEHQATFVNH